MTPDAAVSEDVSRGPWPRAVVVVGGFAAITVPASAFAAQLPGGGDGTLGLSVRAVAGAAVVALLVLVVARHFKRGPGHALGLRAPRRGWGLLAAVASASAVAVALLTSAALMTGSATFDSGEIGNALRATAIAAPLLLIAVVLPEELAFRGALQHLLYRHKAPMSAIATQALCFSAVASVGSLATDGMAATLTGVGMSAFLTGVGLGYLRLLGHSLWGVLGLRLTLALTTVFTWHVGLEFTRGGMLWNFGVSVAAFVTALLVARVLRGDPASSSAQDAHARRPRRELTQKGILYDVGTSYLPGQHSRARWRADVVAEELRVIHADLHCTAVMLFGESPQRLEEAAQMALQQGLYVWLQPRRFDQPLADVQENLIEVADIAERLRTEYPDQVGLNMGCEVSLLHRGILPGDLTWRMRWLAVTSAIAPPYLGWRLNRVLQQMAGLARERFGGPLTYAAGTWESVNWRRFDAVGVNYYTDELTIADYRGGLRRLAAYGKPVLVTEFGSCSYEGAQDKGGSGADIMDWSDLNDRRIKGGHERNERVQADHLEAQLDVFETEDVDGAFLCMFIEGDCHYSTDPTRDLDMASFGIVRPPEAGSGLSTDDGHWEPKRAFYALASRYQARTPAEPS